MMTEPRLPETLSAIEFIHTGIEIRKELRGTMTKTCGRPNTDPLDLKPVMMSLIGFK